MPGIGLRLTPQAHLCLEEAGDAPPLDEQVAARLVPAFAAGTGPGLLQLGAGEIGQALPPVFTWWRGFAARYVTSLCVLASAVAQGDALPIVAPPNPGELASLVLTAPMMPGAEYVDADVLRSLWAELASAFAAAFASQGADLQGFLNGLNRAWTLVGRVHFNLAENRKDEESPFAFMATYTTRLSAQARAQHVPLGQALREYAGNANREKLLTLLLPVQRAAQSCAWLKPMIDAGEIFHPLRWSAGEAARFLASVPELEQSGVVVRMPAGWHGNRPARPMVTAKVGSGPPASLGLDALLDFSMDVTLGGERLTAREVKSLLAGTDNLVLLRGQWVEVDRARLQGALEKFREAERLAAEGGLTFAEAMRLISGAAVTQTADETATADWASVSAGPWLAEILEKLRAPDGAGSDPGSALRGVLRPYQKQGVAWLRLLSGLGLGACLADDMGLGKTIQILALLLLQGREDRAGGKPSLLVAPVSLLANWVGEIEKFAPGLRARILHPSVETSLSLKQLQPGSLKDVDLAITSYGTLLRLPVLEQITWRLVVLDEAQAIKNPGARQTRAAKALRAQSRIALTGTPVENHFGDLWSIFDFINPGLLGSAKQFRGYTRLLEERQANPYGPLRELVRPYILRRMKTDKSVIADLPDKTEMKAFCGLSRRQAALYEQSVAELAKALENTEGIQRKGIVLSTLMRLKQICNHPSQWLNDGAWEESESGKFEKLREIAEVVAARQEKMLVFSQFREMTDPLAHFLAGIFGRPGLVLHGGTKVADRRALVQKFQAEDAAPFFVLSLKAGGSGLTLTAASHVVHFDRWWNPAVENQATDRAFRIGQKKNVVVHKFICQGTLEAKIDAMIESKQGLSDSLLNDSAQGEINLTEMRDDELMRLVRLDVNAAMKEA